MLAKVEAGGEVRFGSEAEVKDARQRQILDVEKVYALTEDLRLMVLLDPEALSRVPPTEAPLEDR
jgi:hypothetical protein